METSADAALTLSAIIGMREFEYACRNACEFGCALVQLSLSQAVETGKTTRRREGAKANPGTAITISFKTTAQAQAQAQAQALRSALHLRTRYRYRAKHARPVLQPSSQRGRAPTWPRDRLGSASAPHVLHCTQ